MNRKINAVCFALILAGTCAIAWQSCTPKQEEVANATEQPNSTEQLDVTAQPNDTEQPVEVVQPTEYIATEETVKSPLERKNCVPDSAKELYVTGLPTLAPEDHLEWESNNDSRNRKYSTTFYKVDESGNKTELYVMQKDCYTNYRFLSKDKQKLWFSVFDREDTNYASRYYLDGNAGTLAYLTDSELIYLSADENYFVSYDSETAYANGKFGVEETLYIDICNARTGEKVSTIEWPLIYRGWEMTISLTDSPSVINVTYAPDGAEYAEAEIHLDTMTLEVIRDDTNLSYDELPAQYKMNIHP